MRKTSHQVQIARQNERKRKAIHAQAHVRATTLVAEERAKPQEYRQTTAQVIAQVEREFRLQGYGMILSKNTINWHVALEMVGTFPLSHGYKGTMPQHAFNLLMLAVESFIQINQVNSVVVKWLKLMMVVNASCGVAPSECKTKHSVYDRVMRSTNISLNAEVSPVVKERRIRWTTYANLDAWFVNFQDFLAAFDFSGIGDDGELMFMEEQLRQIQNVDKTEISVDGSKTRAGGRLGVSFHDPHLPLTSRSVEKSLLACMGIFGSSAAGECVPLHFQLPTSAMAEEREKIRYDFLIHTLDTRGRFGCAEERIWPCTIGLNEKGGMTDDEFESTSTIASPPSTPILRTRQANASC